MIQLQEPNITFFEEGREFNGKSYRYFQGDTPMHGVTEIIGWIFNETYSGIPSEQLNAAKTHGTMVHQQIDLYTKGCKFDSREVRLYEKFADEYKFEAIHGEYLITDNKYTASSIDLVLKREGDKICLCDTKTTSDIHYPNVILQLSIYAALFEKQTNMKVDELAVLWLPHEKYTDKTPKFEIIPRVDEDICMDILDVYDEYLEKGGFDDRRDDFKSSVMKVSNEYLGVVSSEFAKLPEGVNDLGEVLINVESEKKKLESIEAVARKMLTDYMMKNGYKKIENERFSVTLRLPGKTTKFASADFKKDNPDTYEKYCKEYDTKASITIKIKK